MHICWAVMGSIMCLALGQELDIHHEPSRHLPCTPSPPPRPHLHPFGCSSLTLEAILYFVFSLAPAILTVLLSLPSPSLPSQSYFPSPPLPVLLPKPLFHSLPSHHLPPPTQMDHDAPLVVDT